MYAKFFGLQQEPFSIAPDPRYLFMSERHRDALAHLLYGLRGGGGFVLLTGEIGAGKTTVCRCFLEQVPEQCQVAYIFNPKLTVLELLRTVCEEFHIEPPAGSDTVKPLVDAINAFLLKAHADGRNCVLIIDEAQNLSAEVLEQLRLLTNLETSERKLLQIVLIGQPELRQVLQRPELEQLAQRVIARFHLEALSEAETAQYIHHRLGVAGFDGSGPFDRAAIRRIQRLSRGVPRRINLLCDRALLGAYSQGRRKITARLLEQAAAEVFGVRPGGRRALAWTLGLAGLGVAVAAAATWVAVGKRQEPHVIKPVAAASAPPPAVASAPASAVPPFDPNAPLSLALRNERDGWRELLSQWGQVLPEGETGEPCAAVKQLGLQCLRSEGGLAQLRLLARPALLSLIDGSGQRAYALLVRLDEESAELQAGGHSQRVGLAALSRQWRGEFALLWRVPPGYDGQARAEPLAGWLDQQLAKALGEAAAGDGSPRPFDAALQARVAAFQRAQGLRADGLAGPITLMQLNRAAGIAEPRLGRGG
ncbi:AAA family ATPase [Pelomonas sp. SE-A7]|uniref:ExeA family protein n=1 Tax=Pelomonas sp. SE-A7 TaxID=3054953 RepID=UPI00259C727A|nr:AAA family ATPase [Pelomonas sp. SE-A7]MDM4768159.1 AAA family ATPase [Pelomonas sp. SE-A7]